MKTSMPVVTTLALLLLVMIAGPATALPGELDASFGEGGVVTTTFVKSAFVGAMVIQPDGKIVAAGSNGYLHAHFALARYNPNGSLDASFGGDGRVLTSLTGRFDRATAVALQADGKIVAAGRGGGYRGRFAVARYNTDGSLDLSFGGDGKVLTNLSRKDDAAQAVGIEPDGSIVTAGFAGGTEHGRFALVRYAADGSLDPSFGGDGKVLTNLTRGNDFAAGMAIQTDGLIITAGRADGGGGRVALVRYALDGSLDTTFGGDGKVFTNFSRWDDYASSVLIQADGQILVAGTAGEKYNWFSDTKFALARYDTDGPLDPTFGGDGRVVANVTGQPDYANAVGIQSDGKIVVAGTVVSTASCCEAFTVLARFTSSGPFDHAFGDDGKVFTPYQVSQGALAVAVQPDGKIVVAGAAECFSAECRFSLLRYLGT
jgi:uncharacterized delta-60 repeat protein